MRKIGLIASLLVLSLPALAQELKSGPYELPYKNTYVKNIFVAENPYRTLPRETVEPGSFEKARKVLPAPFWEGHQEEVDMYWHAWKIAVGNIRQPQEDSSWQRTRRVVMTTALPQRGHLAPGMVSADARASAMFPDDSSSTIRATSSRIPLLKASTR